MSDLSLINACDGTTSLSSAPFRPLADYSTYLDLLNKLYDDQSPMIEQVSQDDKISLKCSTYLVKAISNWDTEEFELKSFNQSISNLRSNYGDSVDMLSNTISTPGVDTNSIAIGDLIAAIIEPNQQVQFFITDDNYGNSEFTIEK